MRVLHFYKTFNYNEEYGGVQEFIRQLAMGGVAEGVDSEVLALTSSTPGTKIVDGIKIHLVKRLFKFASTDISFGILSTFKQLSSDYDVIHYHFPYPLTDVAHFWAKIKKPCLVTYHSDIVAQKFLFRFYRPLMNRFLRSVSAIVATSPNYLASSPVLNNFLDKTHCIPFGLPQISPPSPELLEFWSSRLPERFFLFVGVLRYYKGLDYLLTAVKGLPCPIVLLGQGMLEKQLKDRAISENITNIHFLGSLPNKDKEALLSLCYGFVFPSHLRSEAFGFSLLEAARQGRPMICCAIDTGTDYINIHGQSGLVVPPADSDALKKAILTLWEDPELTTKLGFGAKQRFNELFTSDRMVKNYISLYKTLVKGYHK